MQSERIRVASHIAVTRHKAPPRLSGIRHLVTCARQDCNVGRPYARLQQTMT